MLVPIDVSQSTWRACESMPRMRFYSIESIRHSYQKAPNQGHEPTSTVIISYVLQAKEILRLWELHSILDMKHVTSESRKILNSDWVLRVLSNFFRRNTSTYAGGDNSSLFVLRLVRNSLGVSTTRKIEYFTTSRDNCCDYGKTLYFVRLNSSSSQNIFSHPHFLTRSARCIAVSELGSERISLPKN